MLPEPALKKAREELLDYRETGMSVMELSHRSKIFEEIIKETEALFREVMNIPKDYKVLFLQGGASLQFAMVPMNLFNRSRKADYVSTGSWAKKAIEEASRYGTVSVVASSEDRQFCYIPEIEPAKCTPDADYLHITTNNTIYGTRFAKIPETGKVPLVADMSSNILSEVYDVSQFGLIYAGAQKNIGPAGLTVVIIREDLIVEALDGTPTMLQYKIHAEKNSLYNTPPCYCIYMAKLTLGWLKEQGGVAGIEKLNREKARLLYDFLDNSSFFSGTADPEYRSLMNVTFRLPSEELTQRCVKEAEKEGLLTLKGHRSVGGMRASIFNAMPIEGVKKLVGFLEKFEHDNR